MSKKAVVSALRLIWWRYDEARKLALQLATVRVPVVNKDGTVGKKYRSYRRCAECGELFEPKDVHVDHVTPVGTPPSEGFSFSSKAWIAWLIRMGGFGQLQVLCRECHRIKSKDDVANIRNGK